jgi:hypothetical protein
MNSAFAREFAKAAQEGPRLFFAPIVGAVEAVRSEIGRWKSTDRQTKTGNSNAPSEVSAHRR